MNFARSGAAARSRHLLPLLLAWIAAGCGGMVLGEPGTPASRRDGAATAARADAAARALAGALLVRPPYEEQVLLVDARHSAVAYRVELSRGEQLDVVAEPPRLRRGGVRVEVFLLGPGGPRRVAAAKRGEHRVGVRAKESGIYVARVQPEPSHEGSYRIALRGSASTRTERSVAGLVFPVAGHDAGAIGSWFGDSRDGGARSHRGVDIFAPRGTLALAAADGIVTSVATTALGGRVVWLAARALGLEFYYAHLEEQLVSRGERVRAGDPIGRVGNTGNARGTRPHLHFGVYRGGGQVALDPAGMLRGAGSSSVRLASAPVRIEVDVGSLGEWQRTRSAELALRAGPDLAARILAELPRQTPVRLIGANRDWYRVALPDGTVGFASAEALERADARIATHRLERSLDLRAEPADDAPVVAPLEPGTEVAVLARYGDYLLVKLADGATGWIAGP